MTDILIFKDKRCEEFEVFDCKGNKFLGLFKGMDALMKAIKANSWKVL